MSRALEKTIREMIARDLRVLADDEYIDADQQGEMTALADRMENGTASEVDWIEALQQITLA